METEQHLHHEHDEHHHDHHGHHHHHHVPESINKIFIFCVILNLLFVVIEAVVGIWHNSVGLLSDAGHNLSDVFSLLLALLALHLAKAHSNSHFTYGYKKSTVLVSLLNAVILLVAVGAIIIESIYRLKEPSPVSGEAISWTAGIGIVVNGLTTWLLMKDSKHDLNIRGAYLHMLADTLVSVGVVISGIIITFKGWVWIDPVISLAIACIILISTFHLLKESLYLSLDAVPESVDVDKIKESIDKMPEVSSWHHLHVWAISTTENAATLHVVLKDMSQMEEVKHQLKQCFKDNGVGHCTIELENSQEHCCEMNCGQA